MADYLRACLDLGAALPSEEVGISEGSCEEPSDGDGVTFSHQTLRLHHQRPSKTMRILYAHGTSNRVAASADVDMIGHLQNINARYRKFPRNDLKMINSSGLPQHSRHESRHAIENVVACRSLVLSQLSRIDVLRT